MDAFKAARKYVLGFRVRRAKKTMSFYDKNPHTILYMGFMENIAESLGLKDIGAERCFRAVLIGEESCYLENVASVKSYSPDKIELYLKKGGLKITGENLFIKKFCAGDLAVCGKIKAIEKT